MIIYHLTMQDEYNCHHEFLDSIPQRDSKNVKEKAECIRKDIIRLGQEIMIKWKIMPQNYAYSN